MNKRRITSSLLSILMLINLAGCSKKEDKQSFKTEFPKEDFEDIGYAEGFRGYEVSFGEEMELSSLSEIKERVSEWEKYKSDCELEFLKNSSIVFEKIKRNSFKLLGTNLDFLSAFQIENDPIKSVQVGLEDVLMDVLNDFLRTATNDVNGDLHRMKSLGIVLAKNLKVNGYYFEKYNCSVLSFDKVKSCLEDPHGYDELYALINRVINVVRLYPCDCSLDLSDKFLELNDNFLWDAATVSDIFYYDKGDVARSECYLKAFDRTKERSFWWLAIFNKDSRLDDYYNAIFNSDISALHTFFDIKTDEEIEAFYNACEAIDTIFHSDEAYKSYLTLFSQVLARLTEYSLNNNDFSLKDNLAVYAMIREDLSRWYYHVDGICDYTDGVLSLDGGYKLFLSNLYGVSIDEINDYLTSEELDRYLKSLDDTSSELFVRFPILKDIIESNPSVTNLISFKRIAGFYSQKLARC